MNKKIAHKRNKLTRQDLADTSINMTYHERLINAKSIDIKNNYIIEDLENGYIRIKIIDKNKLAK